MKNDNFLIRCIDSSGFENMLTEGRMYFVEKDILKHIYIIIDDAGRKYGFKKARFVIDNSEAAKILFVENKNE